MRPKFIINATTNTDEGMEVYDECSAYSRRDVAKRIRQHIKGFRNATNFVFTVTRVGPPAGEGDTNA